MSDGEYEDTPVFSARAKLDVDDVKSVVGADGGQSNMALPVGSGMSVDMGSKMMSKLSIGLWPMPETDDCAVGKPP
jgi:hypothetical protein